MPDWWHSQINSPYYFLVFGIIFVLAAVVAMCTGKVYGRYGVMSSRAKEPTQFWWGVGMYYIGGICFIGYFLYKVWRHLK